MSVELDDFSSPIDPTIGPPRHELKSLAEQRERKAKPGPRPRGDRKATMVRLPLDHYEVYEHAAQELGLALGTYITLILAEKHGLPVPDYITQEQNASRNAEAARQRLAHQMEFDMARTG